MVSSRQLLLIVGIVGSASLCYYALNVSNRSDLRTETTVPSAVSVVAAVQEAEPPLVDVATTETETESASSAGEETDRSPPCPACPACDAMAPPPTTVYQPYTLLDDESFGASGDLHVCVGVRTFAGHISNGGLLALLSSLVSQDYGILDVFIFDTGVGNAEARREAFLNVLKMLRDARVHLARETLIPSDNTVYKSRPDFAPTDRFLARMLELTKNDAKHCSHFLITQGDNYYAPTFLSTLLPHLRDPKTIVAGTDFINKVGHHPDHPGQFLSKAGMIRLAYRVNFYDLGSAVYARAACAATSFLSATRERPLYAADAWFMEDVLAKFPSENKVIVPMPLFSHN